MRVKEFILPIGFIILDFKEDLEILMLLGRPFLATSKATIDVGKGEMMMEVGREVETFSCVEPEPKANEVFPNSDLECQVVQVVSDQATNNMEYLKWCMFVGSRSRM